MEKIESLKKRKEFDSVYRHKVSKANRHLVIYCHTNNLDSNRNRIGISVSKKVGNSVVRHRVTRLIREAYRLNQQHIQLGYDLVVVARVQAKDKNYNVIEASFIHVLKQLDIFKE